MSRSRLSQSSSAAVQDYNLLDNPGLEVYDPPYGQYDGVDCQVGTGWQRFWYDGPEPGWIDARVFASSHLGTGWVEKIEGETCQLVVSTEPYTAGLLQQVTGMTPGVGYGFHAAMLTIFQTSAQTPVDGTMIKQVGMDPTGEGYCDVVQEMIKDADDMAVVIPTIYYKGFYQKQPWTMNWDWGPAGWVNPLDTWLAKR